MDSEIDDSQIDEKFPSLVEEKIIKPNGDELIKKYKKGKFLGKGGFAKCYEFVCLNNKKLYAVKVVSKANLNKSSAKQKLKSEIKIHKSLFHKHIVKFEHVFEDPDYVYILLELCKNKTLSDLMKKRKVISEFECRYFTSQIIKAVSFMHKNKIIHRDLKLGNLFLNEEMEIKIGDFGLATIIEFPGQLRYTVCGTPNYIAPEILEGKNTGHSYEVDFWAIGVIVYTLIIGRPPFETEDVKETYKRIKSNSYTYPTHVYVSDISKDFIDRLLVIDPTKRLSVEEMKNHPFIKDFPPPKTIPTSIVNNPISTNFIMTHKSSYTKVNYNNMSKELLELDKENLNKMAEFCNNGIVKVDNQSIPSKFKSTKEEVDNYIQKNKSKEYLMKRSSSLSYARKDSSVMNMKYLENFRDISPGKEVNSALKKLSDSAKLEILSKTIHFEKLIDLGEEFGIAYITNNLQVGVIFMDKTVLFKNLQFDNDIKNNKNQSYYLYSWKLKPRLSQISELNRHPKLKNKASLIEKIIAEFKNEIPDFFKNENESKKNEDAQINLKSNLKFPVKMYRSNLAYFIKFSDNNMQVIFYDYTKLLIGSANFPYLVYWDRKETPHIFCIHQINKAKNKNMLKRYEHYKKVFYEKLEQYVSNRVATEEVNKNQEAAIYQEDNNLELEMLSSSHNNEQELNKTL